MKNLVVCCDGTGNQTGRFATNVLRLQRLTIGIPGQVVHYGFGVGTRDQFDPWGTLPKAAELVFALATGDGLPTKIVKAYQFLARNYEEGDRIFLFGFSRGAYAVRILAAMIYKIGLLPAGAEDLAGSALYEFERFSQNHGWDEDATEERGAAHDDAYLFARHLGSRWITIDFVGVWDTVASLIRPNADNFLIPGLAHLKFTRRNPSVKIFRHAMAIDERRRMFPLDHWIEPQDYYQRRFDEKPSFKQDVAQVWFVGDHADVGGGHPEDISGLSKYPLIWMVEEAKKAGLTINGDLYNRLAWGKDCKDIQYAEPKVAEPQKMAVGWRILELSRFRKYKKFYIPDGKPRLIPDGALIHQSVFECMDEFAAYRPRIPDHPQKVPMPAGPG